MYILMLWSCAIAHTFSRWMLEGSLTDERGFFFLELRRRSCNVKIDNENHAPKLRFPYIPCGNIYIR